MPPLLRRIAVLLAVAPFLSVANEAGAATTATTLPAVEVTQLSATFRGQFTSDEWGEWWFEFGATTAYGSELGRYGYSPGTYNVQLSPNRLDPGVDYHYRLVVRTGLFGGPYTYHYGADQTFRTAAPTVPAVVEHTASVTVWQIPSGATVTVGIETGALPTEWWVEYGETQALGSSSARESLLPWQSSQRSTELFPLTKYRAHYYRIFASNALGTSNSSLRSFTTGSAPAPPPPPPAPPPSPPAPAPPSPPAVTTVSSCSVPRVRGLTLRVARRRLQRARCRTGSVRRAYSASVRAGRVLRQSVRAGRRLPVGTRVNLVVSAGRR